MASVGVGPLGRVPRRPRVRARDPARAAEPAGALDAAQTAVAEFVLAIFSLVAAVGTFTLRETFALGPVRRGSLDPSSPAGFARIRATLLVLWLLCLLIGLFGSILAYAAGNPAEAWPYVAGAAVLLVIHAPRAWLLESSRATPAVG